MLVVAYIDNIIIAIKGSVEKRRQQVGKVFDSLLENHMHIEIDKCPFEQSEASFLVLIVSRQSIRKETSQGPGYCRPAHTYKSEGSTTNIRVMELSSKIHPKLCSNSSANYRCP